MLASFRPEPLRRGTGSPEPVDRSIRPFNIERPTLFEGFESARLAGPRYCASQAMPSLSRSSPLLLLIAIL
jgi:hypothetical protein